MTIEIESLSISNLLRIYSANPTPWRRGLPPGKYYHGMVDDFDVTFTIGGPVWHRRRTPEQKAAYLELLRRNRRAVAS